MLRSIPIRLLLIALILTGALTACDWTVNGASRIPSLLRVDQAPDRVASGDTVTLTAVLTSYDLPELRYAWRFETDGEPLVTTDSAVTWIAPDSARTYSHIVSATAGIDSVSSDSLRFDVIVESAPNPAPSDSTSRASPSQASIASQGCSGS